MSRLTIFERIKEETKGKKYTSSWYRRRVTEMASEYPVKRIINDEKTESAIDDIQDDNELREEVRKGHLYLYQYKPTKKGLPYWDTYPLVYVLRREGSYFIGANLHYMSPKARSGVIQSILEDKKVEIPKKIIHKYLYNGVIGRLLDLGQDEWKTAIYLPIENFVYEKGGRTLSYDKNKVWQRTYKYRMDQFLERAIIESYTSETKK